MSEDQTSPPETTDHVPTVEPTGDQAATAQPSPPEETAPVAAEPSVAEPTPPLVETPLPDTPIAEAGIEQEVKHALSHLEEEAKTIFVTWPENEIKAFLAWVAAHL